MLKRFQFVVHVYSHTCVIPYIQSCRMILCMNLCLCLEHLHVVRIQAYWNRVQRTQEHFIQQATRRYRCRKYINTCAKPIFNIYLYQRVSGGINILSVSKLMQGFSNEVCSAS